MSSNKEIEYATHLVEAILYHRQQLMEGIVRECAHVLIDEPTSERVSEVEQAIKNVMESLLETMDVQTDEGALLNALAVGGFFACDTRSIARHFFNMVEDGAFDHILG